MDSGWTVSLDPIDDVQALELDWKALEKRSQPSYFQSWGWIGSWLGALPEHLEPCTLTVRMNASIVGMSVAIRGRQHRRGFIRSQTVYVNASGDIDLDGIAVEHNGLLIESGYDTQVNTNLLAWLNEDLPDWDEFCVNGMNQSEAIKLADLLTDLPMAGKFLEESPYYQVDLNTIRDSDGDYLASLSRNTRYQVRRAIKKYSAIAPIEIFTPTTLEETITCFNELESLHNKYWHGRDQPGAFSGKFRQDFHHNLIHNRFPHGEIQILRVQAGDQVIGYLYNFCFGGVISNYQSGFDYEFDAKLKPGLVCHTLAIQSYADGGIETYDFLMGHHQYKKSLSNTTGQMVKFVVQRPRLKFAIEDSLRKIRNRMRKNAVD